MADVLKAWLLARLGVIMDLTPEMFGRYTRDGTLLAQILHSYDIISSNQLSTIIHTQDPALSRVNLKTLRIWLKLINVTLSDECLEEISKGKGAAALQLFYKVYLSLEGKDRLHFIALQKEREKFVPRSSRFDVYKVSEEPLYQPPEHYLSKQLIDATDTILWHRDKFWRIVEACKRERQQFEATMRYPMIEPVEHIVPKVLPDEKQKESEKLDEFARKHPPRKTKKRYQVVECCPGKRSIDVSCAEDPAAATEYIDFLKKRSERAIKSQELKLKKQTTMMTDSWEKLLRKEDRSFDEALGRRVLDQSRYEKQMMRKLCEVWDVKNKIVENRRIVDRMLLDTRESELRLEKDRCREAAEKEVEQVRTESCRMRELQRRIREETLCRLRKKHRRICTEIARDLADIAVRAADCRKVNDNRVPSSIWSEWRMLFLKNQPIFEFVADLNEIKDANDDEKEPSNRENTENKVITRKVRIKDGEEMRNEEQQRLVQLELERQSAMADADLENYLDLAPPWDEFVPRREEAAEEVFGLGRVVLGYVVHRLLENLYPYPTEVATSPVPRVRIATVIQGITSPALQEQLRELLKKNDVRLLRMEDAINHCLERYKREMEDVEYIDLNITSATARDVKGLEARSKMNGTKDRQPKRLEKARMTTFQQSTAEEKQTQTPRRIPYDDLHPMLSDTAYIGKWTYEFLTLGQPISNELNTKILIEQLKGIGDAEGWALINYPSTYEQMAMLEKALTGYEVPPDRRAIDFADVSVEDIDPPSPRIVFEGDEVDTLAACRQSRLLPNPISSAKHRHAISTSTTFMTMYIKAMLKPRTLNNQDQPCMPLPNDATSMDEYYANQNIAYGFYYSALDLPTMKELAEFITGDRLPERSSLDPSEKQERSIDSKKAIIKRWLSKSKWENLQCEMKKDIDDTENRFPQSKTKTQPASSNVRPGEDGWQWLDLPQSLMLLESLATIWENIEQAYVENLKKILSLKRVHTSAILPYKDLLLRNLTKFVDRPDKRQELLHDFHRVFNEIEDDLREDLDMKCELHCRVADFRAELWELCDARRREAEEERRRILRNQWVLVEAVALVNVYVGILQAEIDRFVDTVQLLQYYYASMLQKRLQESRFSNILLDRFEMANDFAGNSKPETLDESMKDKEERTASKTKTESTKASARAADIDRFRTEIESLLIDVSKSFDPDQSAVYSAIKESIRLARGAVDSISSAITETLKKEEKAAVPKTEVKKKANKDEPDSTFAKVARRGGDLVEEWRYAVLFEIDRIRQRLDVLSAAARSDVIFLLDTMRQTFHRVCDYIVERYKREIESINDMANVFCFAVEEARPIQEELLLDGDRFVVRPNVLMFSDDPERFAAPIREAPSPLRFRMVQLGRLLDIFRRVAPHGTMSERALVYILQDLVSCGEEDCYPATVPCAWRQLRPPDIGILILRLFGPVEHVDWREFIVRAMDLPVPSHRDILRTRAAFRMRDPESRETVNRVQYRSTPLWFLECTEETSPEMERVLHENLREMLPNQIIDIDDYDNAIKETTLLRTARLDARTVADSNSRNLLETSEDNTGATLRSMLAKELLCLMYLVDRHTMNYTAMLLAFCKDEDPREGLGKAFTLAMGARVCTDVAEGERYVEELVEEKRLAKEMELSRDYLREEANEIAREIINHIMNRTARGVAALERRRSSSDYDLAPNRRVMIQKLDGFGEVDPVDLVPDEVTPEHLIIEDSSVIRDDREYERTLVSVPLVASEDHEKLQPDKRVIFWLPRDVCLTVLATCLPWYATQADLFQTSLSLREGISRAYDELKDDDLNREEDVVLAHRLVNHSFIRKLLSASTKFVSKDVAALLRDILKDRNTELQDNLIQ